MLAWGVLAMDRCRQVIALLQMIIALMGATGRRTHAEPSAVPSGGVWGTPSTPATLGMGFCPWCGDQWPAQERPRGRVRGVVRSFAGHSAGRGEAAAKVRAV